jgi:hypothetical protein
LSLSAKEKKDKKFDIFYFSPVISSAIFFGVRAFPARAAQRSDLFGDFAGVHFARARMGARSSPPSHPIAVFV